MIKNIYGNIKMSWAKVVCGAVIAGLYTGAVMLLPFLKNTSFQDIGITYEWWVVFAVLIVVNCRKNWEAMLKCFTFFLISQPLVYAVEILFGMLSFDKAMIYYRTIWLPMTFLTLPGGFIAYYCKQQNALGSVILGLGNTIQGVLAVFYIGCAVKQFPHHLLSGLVCIASVFVMSFGIQKEKKNRWMAIIVPALLTVAIVLFAKQTGRTLI